MKKIGIMGSHCTGKTTACTIIKNYYNLVKPEESVHIVTETARECPWPINEASSRLAQRWLFHKQLTKEFEVPDCDVIICDRTSIDSLAYADFNGYADIVCECMPIALSWLKTYDEIYYLGLFDVIEDDGVRSTDIEFQSEVAKTLKFWIEKYEIPVRTRGSLERKYGKWIV